MSEAKVRVVLTPGGRRRLEARIEQVRAEFSAIVDDMPAALESGDTSGWHDNFAFEDNQRRQQQLALRLRELERLKDSAGAAAIWTSAPERAYVGAGVRWCYADEPEQLREVWIAGYGDGAPDAGRVSYDAPLGRALLGAEPGDERELHHNGARRKIEVLAILPTPPGADEHDLALAERAAALCA